MTPKCNNIRFIYLHGHPYEIEDTFKLYVSLLGPKGVYLLQFICMGIQFHVLLSPHIVFISF